MKKLNYGLGLVLVSLLVLCGVQAFAGSSGVSDPTISLEQFSPSGGLSFAKLVKDSLDSLDTAVEAVIDNQDAQYAVLATASAAGSVNALTNTVTITAKDASGTTLTGVRLLDLWTSETSGGAVSTNNIESVTPSVGSTILSSSGSYKIVTGTNGTYVAAIIGTAAGTNYVNVVGPNGAVVSAAVVFE